MKKNIISYKEYYPEIGEGVFVADSADVIGRVKLGDDANIWFNVVIRGDVNNITVGKRTNIQDGTVVHISHDAETHIGDDVTVGHNAIIHGCRIENNVLIGMGACVLDNAVIPKNCVVGAGSLVTQGKTYPENSLIIGSPAKSVRTLTDEEVENIKRSAKHYVEFAKDYME